MILLMIISLLLWMREDEMANSSPTMYSLPEVEIEEGLNNLLYHRRSVRSYGEGVLDSKKLGDLFFASLGVTIDGITGATRTTPSAGATNPLVIYGYLDSVEGFEQGLYKYHPTTHNLELILPGDLSDRLTSYALGQSSLSMAQLVLLITADFSKTTARYGERGISYVYMEVGHSAQNVLLKVQELGLKAVVIGAFYEEEVQEYLKIPQTPLLMIPMGVPH